MSFHYDATSDFHTSIAEVETLLTLSSTDDTNRTMFLKLSMVSLVTKFQVFVEKILEEFRYQLNDKPSGKLPLYLKMNSLRIGLEKDNVLIGLSKHNNFTEKKKKPLSRRVIHALIAAIFSSYLLFLHQGTHLCTLQVLLENPSFP